MDPELDAVIALLPPELANPDDSFADPPALRARLADMAAKLKQSGLGPVQDPRVSRRDLLAPGASGEPDVPVRLYEPEGRTAGGPVILHFHGGAFVIGDIAQDDQSCERLAVASGRPVVSVEYRLAPEHPFPAGITDCFAVYQWLTGGHSGLAVDAQRVVVTGVSAGAGLAAALALKARDAGGIQPMYQLLLYPVLDDRMATPSMKTLLDQPLWNGRSSVHMWRHYLGSQRDDVSPYAAPARARDLTGLPPASITTAEFDPLRDEAIEYAQRLMQAGVPTELHVVPGVIHAFDSAAADIGLARRIRDDRSAALATVLLRTPEESAPKPGERWLDPDVASVVPFLPVGEGDADLATGRRLLEEMLSSGPDPIPGEERLTITHEAIPGPAGAPDVPVIIYRPRDEAGPVACIVDYHGGAFCLGSAKMDHPANVRIASQLGVVIVSVDYRLAPEHRYPAGVQDSYTALCWAAGEAEGLGADPARVVVSGESAGAAIAAALTLMSRDRSGPAILYQRLLIPVLDNRCLTTSAQQMTGVPIFDAAANRGMWRAYLGEHEQASPPPYAVPGRAADLTGLPAAFIQAAQFDPARDEAIEYAQRLLHAGVPVELHVVPRAFHGFALAARSAVARRAFALSLAALSAKLIPAG